MNRRQLGFLALTLALPPRTAPARARFAAQPRADSAVAIERVTVLPMTGDEAMSDATVIIEADRIVAIDATATVDVPERAVRVDGSGRWLMPALTDTHVHFSADRIPELPYGPDDVLSPFLANGVLQIVDLASNEQTNALRDDVAAGTVRAPRIASARLVDGDPPFWGIEISTVVRTPDEARQAVTDIVAAGYDSIKVYNFLDLESFGALLDAAAAEDIRVIGHIPGLWQGHLAEAVLPGLEMVTHAQEFAYRSFDLSDAIIAEYVDLALANGVGLIPTLFLDEQLLAQTRDPEMLAAVEGLAQVDPAMLPLWFEFNRLPEEASPARIAELEAIVDFDRRLVKAFVDAGILVLTGTDSGNPGLAPGYSLHEELQALARAGLTNGQILEAATSAPARWLGVADDRGTVEVGRRANLLLHDADPRDDIRHTRAIAAVIHDGRLLERPELDTMMSDLDALYTPVRALFSPRASEIFEAR